MQNTLASRYEVEPPNSVFRNAILEALVVDGETTPAAKSLLIRVADSPRDSLILAQVVQDSKAPPGELLPQFANHFILRKTVAKKLYLPGLLRNLEPLRNRIFQSCKERQILSPMLSQNEQ